MRSAGGVASAVAVLCLATAVPALGQSLGPERCAECHLELNDDRLSGPARMFATDVHARAGFGCLACHGGMAGHDASVGFLSKPGRVRIPELCGSCHADAAYMRNFNPSMRVDQLTEYVTSVHGQRLAMGDTAVATCVDCHGAHRTRPPTDPQADVFAANVATTCGNCHADATRMAAYGIPTDQLDEYRNSVHGRMLFDEGDLSAPTCNDCHGNHGAAPPGIGSIRAVCGQCHATMADFFGQSGHSGIFEDAGLPGCETCHGNHDVQPVSDATLSDRAADVCAQCHEPGDTLGAEFNRIASLLDSLKAEFARSRELLETAENAGMEVSQAMFELEEVNNALTMARSAIHSFRVEPVAENVTAGLALTQAGIDRGIAALEEHRFRRVGLALSATIILVLIIGLVLKIRQLDRAGRAAGPEPLKEERHV
jgi:predicted CXXCH cytochrome family protein